MHVMPPVPRLDHTTRLAHVLDALTVCERAALNSLTAGYSPADAVHIFDRHQRVHAVRRLRGTR